MSASLPGRLQQVYEFSCGIFDMLDWHSGGYAVLIQIHASFDDVGTRETDGFRAVVGYVAHSATWRNFNGRWINALAQHKKESLHTSQYLYDFPLIGGMDDEAMCLVLAPYLETIKSSLLADRAIPICVITDCDAYESLSDKEKKFVRPDLENSFEVAVSYAANALMGSQFLMSEAISIQMDESSDVPRLYAAYQWMKRQQPELKNKLGGVCFLDDKNHPPIQAADVLGNVLIKTWRRAGAEGARMPRALKELTYIDGRPTLKLIHFDAHNLKTLARRRMTLGNKLALDGL